jgi:hypothetical protein
LGIWLKQSTAVDVSVGPFLDDADGKTPETALTITQPDIRLKKGGAAWGQKNAAQTLSHEENGWYEISLDATDTNTLGSLLINVFESGALPVWREFMVVPANVYDSMFGADLLQVDVREVTGTAQTARDLGANIDASISSRSTYAGGAVASVTADVGITQAAADKVWNTTIRTLTGDRFKKNTAFNNFMFVMTDAITHVPKTGLTNASFTKRVSIDAAASAALSGTITELDATNHPGVYKLNLTAGELNGNNITLRFAAADADETVLNIITKD